MTLPVAIVTSTIPMTIHRFHQELIRQLKNAGFDVVVASSPGRELDRIARESGVRIHTIPMVREISPRADARALSAWLRLCRKEKPALIVTATPKASLLGHIAAATLRTPSRLYYIGGLRVDGERGPRARVLAAVERLTAGLATDVVCNSPSLRARILELRLVRETKLRQTEPASSHGVDTTHFAPREGDRSLAESLGLVAATPVLGFVGRLTHDKGVDTLIAASEVLADNGIKAQLLIVGPQDEPDSRALLAELKNRRLAVTVVGAVDDVRPYLALMDVHVLPSRREGFPNVVLEASAMGIATVTTDATGCVDSVQEGRTGLVVPAGDTTRLAAALQDLLEDVSRREEMGRNARSWVVAHFRPEAVVRSLLGRVASSTTGSDRGRQLN